MKLLSADPGISKGTSAARFVDGVLDGAALLRRPPGVRSNHPEGWHWMAESVWEWWINGGIETPDKIALEYPQVYTFGKGKGDPNDLFPIACVAQSLAALGLAEDAEVVHYLPSEWKGTRGKLANTVDVRRRLTVEEFARIQIPPNTCGPCATQNPAAECAKVARRKDSEPCLIHNIYDAIGIGLKALGRFERIRVLPR